MAGSSTRTIVGWVLVVLALVAAVGMLLPGRTTAQEGDQVEKEQVDARKTIEDRVREFGPAVRERILPRFHRAKVKYPPARVVLLGLKRERRLEVYAAGEGEKLRRVMAYPIQGASGQTGPKLREGDCQVPEGVYEVEALNPNSKFHLALRVSYPNEADRKRAAEEGRSKLGGDIMIHGGKASTGCLAMGDEVAEELFVLTAETGRENVKVVLSPVDFRKRKLPRGLDLPPWTGELYGQLREELRQLPAG